MDAQSYATHRRLVPLYHYVLTGLMLVLTVGAVVDLYRAWRRASGRLEAAVLLGLVVAAWLLLYFVRIFALKAQDRAIRAEETIRHFALTGKLPDARLRVRQYVALRFASDAELPALARRAAEEGLSNDAIKRAVTGWRADHYRV
ncbi:MAG: DUF6526 family protein [Thermoanaerobaculia bacterium]